MAEEFEPIDYRDLADVVQRLRMIGMRAYLGPMKLRVHVPWFEDLHEFPSYIEAMEKVVLETDGDRKTEAVYMLEETKLVYQALQDGPRKPSADEVVARYVSSEIGDRTARYIMDWDSWQLIEECQKRNLPPMQWIMDHEDEEASRKAMDLLLGASRAQKP